MSNIINLRHPLAQLSQQIDWQSCESRFGDLYAVGVGRAGHPIRLMVGLQLLKHTCNVPDEEAVAHTRKLRTYLGRVIRDIGRKMALEEQTSSRMGKLLQVATRIHSQPRKRADGDPPKLYSVHALEVECIAKGKARKQYEFGVKVGIVSTSKESFVLAAKSLPGNSVEPVIGHLKSDGRLARNFLKGIEGDAMNALLCGAGHNLRKILRKLRLFYALCGFTLRQLPALARLPAAIASIPALQWR